MSRAKIKALEGLRKPTKQEIQEVLQHLRAAVEIEHRRAQDAILLLLEPERIGSGGGTQKPSEK